jgi:hypothetical protein
VYFSCAARHEILPIIGSSSTRRMRMGREK